METDFCLPAKEYALQIPQIIIFLKIYHLTLDAFLPFTETIKMIQKVRGLAKEHVCRTHGHKHQCGHGQRRGGVQAGRSRVKVGGNRDICDSVKNKHKGKINKS